MKYKEVTIPDTADDWELYDKPGVGKVVEALVQASKEAVDMISSASLSEAKTVANEANSHIYKVCDRFGKFGAADSEPLYHARHVVVDAMKVIGGVEVDPWDL